MPRLWSWLRRVCAVSQATAAPPRPPRNVRARVSFDTLEDRLAPSVSPLPYEVWRDFRFQVDDVAVAPATDAFATVQATAHANQSFGSTIGLDQVFANTSYRGNGYSVAVLDTGIDYNHPDLGGGWGKRVVAGYDFVNGDSDPMDDNGHGTHVAGIVGSSNASFAGLAPNVNLIALKVLDANGTGSFGAVEDALNWVIANQKLFNIVAINLSLGSGNFTTSPYNFLEDEFSSLKNQGVFLSVAAGNSFHSYQSQVGLAFPGVSPNVVSVGAVWAGNFGTMAWGSGARDNTTAVDRVASFSQRAPGLSLMAPGAMINSTYLGGQYRSMAGTSMASPVVAGAAVLLRQALDAAGKTANQDVILQLMKSTGDRIIDGDDENDNVANTGLAFQRIHVAAALNAVGSSTGPATPPETTPEAPAANVAPVLAAIQSPTLAAGSSITIGLQAADPNGDPISFSARVVGLNADPGLAHQLKTSLGLFAFGSYYANSFGMNEKWLGGAGGAFYILLPNGELRRWAGTPDSTLAPSNLKGTLEPRYHTDPSLLLNAEPSGASVPVTVSVSGNQLVVTASPAATGSYQIDVTASDGKLATSRTLTVTVTGSTTPGTPVNLAPVLSPIADQTVSKSQRSLVIPLSASDPEGGSLTYSANVVGAANVGAAIVNRQLTLSIPAGLVGGFTVEVTASDGSLAATTSFRVTVVNAPPTLSVPATVTAGAGATTASFSIDVRDPDGDAVTVIASASIAAGSDDSLAHHLKTTYGLTFAGSYFTNSYGLGEKWLRSADGLQFYCILPNGELHRFTGSVADLGSAATRLASLDASVHADPSKLWNAAPATASAVASARVVGNQVVVTLDRPYRGSVTVEVAASDGADRVARTVVVTFP